ncbi:hypothetical protein GTZ99_02645 [Novosphingobium sp. FSY-8]|uniref:BetI-type transcriptional repressor C-terminal domain-containing protein n=1 Tax=Novosphingobium ovatum TaxID=1908523 RepID=A0ABW9XAA9_9SPHN|nr:TetR family transcriptional regulator C-terminal domain-containing protein [Novosphingobium ovatum]NBC35452.1 hypothetical protein [Novosphingobium ovatum]
MIGQTLGIEPAHILYYFGSREELMQAVIRRWDEDAAAGWRSDNGEKMGIDEYLAAIGLNVGKPGIVHLYLAFAAEAVDPQHPAHDFIQQRFEQLHTVLANAIRKEQAEDTIPPEADADAEARWLIAMADGLQLQSLIDPTIDAIGHMRLAVQKLRRV